jgi:DNA-binding NarL/FixJ family response regulator
MARTFCLAGIDEDKVAMLSAVLRDAGTRSPVLVMGLNVTELSKAALALVLCDIDGLTIDSLETLRRLRFRLPDCVIAVYTKDTKRAWGLACHLAGANCLLSKDATEAELCDGLRDALQSGCFTDPRFAAA